MKCEKCNRTLSREEIKEYGAFCSYCVVRYLSASFCKNKKDARRILNMSDEEVEEGIKRIANIMAKTMITAKEYCNRMSYVFNVIKSRNLV